MRMKRSEIVLQHLASIMAGGPVPAAESAELRDLLQALRELFGLAASEGIEAMRAEHRAIGLGSMRLLLRSLRAGLLAEKAMDLRPTATAGAGKDGRSSVDLVTDHLAACISGQLPPASDSAVLPALLDSLRLSLSPGDASRSAGCQALQQCIGLNAMRLLLAAIKTSVCGERDLALFAGSGGHAC